MIGFWSGYCYLVKWHYLNNLPTGLVNCSMWLRKQKLIEPPLPLDWLPLVCTSSTYSAPRTNKIKLCTPFIILFAIELL